MTTATAIRPRTVLGAALILFGITILAILAQGADPGAVLITPFADAIRLTWEWLWNLPGHLVATVTGWVLGR